MRIAVVTTSYPQGHGDPSGHFVEAEVSGLRAAGHEVVVVTPRAGGAFGWPGASTRLRERPWLGLEAAGWIARAAAKVRTSRPERVVAHWCVPSAFPIVITPPRGKVVPELEVVSHGGDIRLLRAMPESLKLRIVGSITARASAWRFVSEELLVDLTEGLPPTLAKSLEKIATVAPSPLAMMDVREDARARRKSIGDRKLFVCASRLVASKGVDRVIDYVAGEQRHHRPVLVILGDGPERAHLERLARAWQIDVRFLGTTPRRETLTWIGAADEVVHASKAEGLSTVVREARELGVPVTILS